MYIGYISTNPPDLTLIRRFWPLLLTKNGQIDKVLYIFGISSSSRFEWCVYVVCSEQTKWNDQKRPTLTIFLTKSGQINEIDPSVKHIWNQLVEPVRTMYNMCCFRHRVALYKISMQILICSVAPPGGQNQKSASMTNKYVISRFYCKKNFLISGFHVAVATGAKF